MQEDKYMSINLRDIPNLNIFVTGEQSKKHMLEIYSLYKENTRELERAERDYPRSQDVVDYYRYKSYKIRIHSRQRLLEWEEYNPFMGVAKSDYAECTPEELEDVVRKVFAHKIRHKIRGP
jgi:acyl-CoA-binding protein